MRVTAINLAVVIDIEALPQSHDVYYQQVIQICRDREISVWVAGCDSQKSVTCRESCTCKHQQQCNRQLYESCPPSAILPALADTTAILTIGSGRYGQCMAQFSDSIFARGTLATSCNAQRIPHHTFKTWFDILTFFRTLDDTKKIFRRRQAELRRSEVFINE